MILLFVEMLNSVVNNVAFQIRPSQVSVLVRLLNNLSNQTHCSIFLNASFLHREMGIIMPIPYGNYKN